MDPYVIALLLYVAALTLAMLDIFVPSGGILMILAVAAALGSILFGFRSSHTMGMSMLTVVAASIPICAVLAVKIWPHTPIGRRIILNAPAPGDSRPNSPTAALEELIGEVFLTESPLMPAGQLKVGHRRINAVVENGIVEVGQTVKVIGVRERSLLVRLTHDPVSIPPARYAAGASQPSPADAPASPSAQPGPSLLDVPAEELGLDSIDE